MKFIKIICLILWLGTLRGNSQGIAPSPDKQSRISRFVYHEKLAFKPGYFGELVLHPGMTVGVDYTLTGNNWLTVHWDIDVGGKLKHL